MKMVNVKLSREWDGHGAGEIVKVEEITAKSMVRKQYGHIVKGGRSAGRKPPSKPTAETATDIPSAETATVTPQMGAKPPVAPGKDGD